ncbi:hypothetical protein GCM10025865_03970 [Paraoerskovia sediminicola]|uniref:Phage shock protein PspC N-terminal domain-containing protein n=1 Tax=Paraoerskovia sediminicola TaxID=1138587 RepID=A0ABM8FZM6_9CELL|nr:PspC domain-containing protein [Paraoerskovia sediminicola]BDZ41098.1 hypothetical protein GCM10025865_03970 [Paraoerskovia sediminicola]
MDERTDPGTNADMDDERPDASASDRPSTGGPTGAPTGAPTGHEGRPPGPGAPPDPTGPDATGPGVAPPSGTGFFASIRRMGLVREQDRWVGGVAAGVAARFGLDPLLVRGLLVLSFFLTGLGLVLYGFAWALLPDAKDGRIHAEQTARGDVDVAIVGAAAVVVAGFSWGDGWWSITDRIGLGWLGGLFWLAAVVGVTYLVFAGVRSHRRSRRAAEAPQAQQAWGPEASTPSAGPAGPAGQPSTTSWSAMPPAPPAPPAPAQANARVERERAEQNRAWADQVAAQKAQQARDKAAQRAEQSRVRAEQRHAEQLRRQQDRPRPAGSTVVGMVLGIMLIGGAGMLLADQAGTLAAPGVLTWVGASLVLVALAILVVGLAGRRSGGLSGIAWLLMVVGVPIGLWTANDLFEPTGVQQAVSSGYYAPTDRAEAEDGLSFVAGDATLDLTSSTSPRARGPVDRSPSRCGSAPGT